MLILGVQYDKPLYHISWSLASRAMPHLIRPSSLIEVKTFSSNSVSNDAAIPIGIGNTVALPLRATPCSASFHQLYLRIPRRSTAGELYIISATFSSKVICFTISSARSLGERETSVNMVCADSCSLPTAKSESNAEHINILLFFIRIMFRQPLLAICE